MPMKRILIVAATISVAIILSVGIFLAGKTGSQELPSKLYAYPVSVGEKTYAVTIVTNWDSEPRVSLSNTSLSSEHHVLVDFFGQSSRKTVFYNITIPTDLLRGNISLIWKYYLQSPDRYILSNNSTHNSIQMTFEYPPYFSGMGHFEICGTEGAW
jgi:hypothetical protein